MHTLLYFIHYHIYVIYIYIISVYDINSIYNIIISYIHIPGHWPSW